MIPMASMECNIDLSEVFNQLNIGQEEMVKCLYDKCYEACPVDTGYMRSTIGTQEDTVYVTADYSPYTEYRTGWFSSAIEDAIPDVKSIMHIK